MGINMLIFERKKCKKGGFQSFKKKKTNSVSTQIRILKMQVRNTEINYCIVSIYRQKDIKIQMIQ